MNAPFDCLRGAFFVFSPQYARSTLALFLSPSTFLRLRFRYGATAAWFILIVCAILLCRQIRVSIQIIKEASKALQSMPSLVFFPLWTMLWIGGLSLYAIYVFAYLMSAGKITPRGELVAMTAKSFFVDLVLALTLSLSLASLFLSRASPLSHSLSLFLFIFISQS